MTDVPLHRKNHVTPLDILVALVFAAAIILSLGMAGVFGTAWFGGNVNVPGNNGSARALVTVDDIEYVYSLSEERTITVNGAEGPAILVIEDGTIRFEDSTCRDLTCVHMGKVGPGAGHFAACLPNKIIVTLDDGLTEAEKKRTGEDDDALDW